MTDDDIRDALAASRGEPLPDNDDRWVYWFEIAAHTAGDCTAVPSFDAPVKQAARARATARACRQIARPDRVAGPAAEWLLRAADVIDTFLDEVAAVRATVHPGSSDG